MKYIANLNCFLLLLCVCLVAQAQPPDMTVDELLLLINDMAAQESESDFVGEFIQITESPQLSNEQIAARIERFKKSLSNEERFDEDLFQSLYESFANDHLRVRKMRVTKIGDFQRIDQITAPLEEYDKVVQSPYSSGLTLINAVGNESYSIDHDRKTYTRDLGKRWRDESELNYIANPFSSVNVFLSQIPDGFARVSDINRIVQENGSTIDTVRIHFPDSGVTYNIELEWFDQTLTIRSFYSQIHENVILSIEFHGYHWNQGLGGLTPKYLEVVAPHHRGEGFEIKSYQVIDISAIAAHDPMEEIQNYLNEYTDLKSTMDLQGEER